MTGQAQPIPKRWWWTKRLVAAYAAFLLASLAGRCWWGHYADSQIQAEIDAIRARGEPLLAKDFIPSPIPDEQNAAELYKRAVACNPLLNKEHPDRFSDADMDRLASMISVAILDQQFRQEHREDLARILEISSESFALARQARYVEGVDWKLDYSSGIFRAQLPRLGGQRDLAKLLCTAALVAHERGDHAAAVENLRDCLAIAAAVDATHTLVDHLFNISIRNLTAETIEKIAPTLQVGLDEREARPERVKMLIDDLLDERTMREGLTAAFAGERAAGYEAAEEIRKAAKDHITLLEDGASGEKTSPGTRLLLLYTLDPVWRMEELRALRYFKGHLAAADAARFPEAVKALPAEPALPEGIRSITWMISSIMLPSLGRSYLLHFECLAQTRMAAAALGMRCYEVERGHRPGQLAELVPDHLDAIPEDPFSPLAGKPVQYAPASPTPLLYSVYRDETDDGGRYFQESDGGFDRWDSPDWVFFLDGDRPTAPVEWRYPKNGVSPFTWVLPSPESGMPPVLPVPTSATDTSSPTSAGSSPPASSPGISPPTQPAGPRP